MITEVSRRHSRLVRAFFFSGGFLLIFSAGTFGSAIFLSHRADVARTKWTEVTASVRDCELMASDPVIPIPIGRGKIYSVNCDVGYSVGGHPYHHTLFSTFTRSEKTRSEIVAWVARNSPETELVLRVNPAYPYEFYVQNPLPFHRHNDPEPYIWGAFAFAAAGLVLIWVGKKLLRAGL